jgi:ATP synthase mitochondrial F1 complex assembly factor 2
MIGAAAQSEVYALLVLAIIVCNEITHQLIQSSQFKNVASVEIFGVPFDESDPYLWRISLCAVAYLCCAATMNALHRSGAGCCRSLSVQSNQWIENRASLLETLVFRAVRNDWRARHGCRLGSSSAAPPRKTGRHRFYLDVGVKPCPPPWKQPQPSIGNSSNTSGSVSSPISAGVDGTDSASGVARTATAATGSHIESYQARLTVRSPRRQLLVTAAVASESSSSETTDHDIGGTNNSNVSSWFTVTLDGRALRTPMGRPLSVPTRVLAHAIAAEWNSVATTIVPLQMPLMTLVCTTLDQTASSDTTHALYQQHCLNYFHTDTICYWADPVEDRILYGRQQSAWQDIYEWFQDDFIKGLPLPAQVYGMQDGALFRRGPQSVTTATQSPHNTRGLAHDAALIEAASAWVTSLDAWHLTALYVACAEAKSFGIAAGLVTQRLSAVPDAQTAARVEEEFNIASWGLVEGQHDYDRLNSAVQLRATALLIQLLDE